jgi:IclR family transcriptional regulator, KDG regulon repressor
MDGTLLKGLKVLETLALSDQLRGITELAHDLELTKSNIHRTLQTLIAAQYVHMPSPGRYACTLKLFELASAVMGRVNVRSAGEPFMAGLLKDTGETVHLSILDKGEVIYLNKLDSAHPVRAYSAIGGRAPAYCVASGKALLAHGGESALAALGSFPLIAHTPRTITTLDGLRREMALIRRQGFAVNRGEWRDTVCGLAAIVLDAGGEPVASIGISGPADRMRPVHLKRYQSIVMDAAKGLSRALGHNPCSQIASRAPEVPPRNRTQAGATL